MCGGGGAGFGACGGGGLGGTAPWLVRGPPKAGLAASYLYLSDRYSEPKIMNQTLVITFTPPNLNEKPIAFFSLKAFYLSWSYKNIGYGTGVMRNTRPSR